MPNTWRRLPRSLIRRSQNSTGAAMALNSTGSDMLLLLLLSGPVAVGKSAIAWELIERHGFRLSEAAPIWRNWSPERADKAIDESCSSSAMRWMNRLIIVG